MGQTFGLWATHYKFSNSMRLISETATLVSISISTLRSLIPTNTIGVSILLFSWRLKSSVMRQIHIPQLHLLLLLFECCWFSGFRFSPRFSGSSKLAKYDQFCGKNYTVLLWSDRILDGWLVVCILWHINLCRLFNTKSIFMKYSSISNNSV